MRLLRWLSYSALISLLWITTTRSQVTWQQLPLKFDWPTRGFYVDSTDTSLYICGSFDTLNGVQSGCIVRVRKDYSVSTPFPALSGGGMACMIKWGGKFFFGGGSLFMWDGNSWHILDNSGTTLCFYPYKGKLLIGGEHEYGFGGDTSLKASLIEYDGTTFRKFKGIDSVVHKSSFISAITEYNGDLIVSGNIEPYPPIDPRFHEILRWTGTKWDAVGNGIQGGGNNEVYSLKVMDGRLYVAGYFTKVSGAPGNSIASWNGSNWDDMGGGFINGGVGGLESRGDTLYASGGGYNIGGYNGYHFGAYTNGKWCINTAPFDSYSGLGKMVDFYGDMLVAGAIHKIGTDTFGNIARIGSLGIFLSPLSVGDNKATQSFSATIFPNPALDAATITFQCDERQTLNLLLTDLPGHAVYAAGIDAKKGEQQYSIPLKGLAAGTYFVKLSGRRGSSTVKLIKH